MPITPFLAATGFLAAILLVWLQSWISIYKPNLLPATASLGLFFIDLSVMVALVAFAWTGWSWSRKKFEENFRVPDLSIGLLVTALIMAGINVGQSLFSTATKFFRGIPPDKPLPELEAVLKTPAGHSWGIIIAISVTAFIIFMSWLGTKKRWAWIAEMAALVMLGIGVIIWISLTS